MLLLQRADVIIFVYVEIQREGADLEWEQIGMELKMEIVIERCIPGQGKLDRRGAIAGGDEG